MDDGTTKNAIWRSPESRRRRKASVPAPSRLAVPDIAGSSAAATDMPNRLTGSVYRSCAFASAVSAPVGRKLAMIASMYALNCTTPRLMNTGMKFFETARTCSEARSSVNRRSLATLSTTGS